MIDGGAIGLLAWHMKHSGVRKMDLTKYRCWDMVENQEGIYSRGTVVYDAYEADKELTRLRERVAELEQYHSWASPQIEQHDERERLLVEALRWALNNGATAVYCSTEGRRVLTSATAESYGHTRHNPPAHLAPLIAEAITGATL